MKNLIVDTLKPQTDYELLDSGDGEKLERYGSVVLSRPDPQALWSKNLSESEWRKADANYAREERQGNWQKRADTTMADRWKITMPTSAKTSLTMWVKPTAFKHTGIFPEQAQNWQWTHNVIQKEVAAGRTVNVLNLFGYTGGASLAAAQAGAHVVHVDSSKAAITWARDNAEASGLVDKPIRWILEDARLFAEREVKRGNKYDAIIMDPPAFGHGANDEVWKIEEHFIKLIETCAQLLSDKPVFFLINGYSAGYSALAYENILGRFKESHGGTIETGELAIEESSPSKRLLPCGIFSRWKA